MLMARTLSATKPRCSRRRPTARDSDAPRPDRTACSSTSNVGCTTVSLAILSIASRNPQYLGVPALCDRHRIVYQKVGVARVGIDVANAFVLQEVRDGCGRGIG